MYESEYTQLMKLLAPGGSFSQIKAAAVNGAEAVYIGVPGFNARRMITGDDAIDSLSGLVRCIEWAHEKNIEVHCALNIIIKDGELLKALQSAEALHRYNVDALIVQDIGLFTELHREFPTLPLHASTQMGINGIEAVKYAAGLGANCVVLPRETSIKEIRDIRSALPDVQLETFVHGALCFAFSGQCYYSAFIGGRSGNRGLCGQPCRKQYEHGGKRGHLFSCKDLCLIDDLKTLEDAGISYLKIEGRAKDAAYTAKIVRSYREALKGYNITSNLDYVFNRGYTTGLIFNDTDTLNTAYITHKGVAIGQVTDVTDDDFTVSSSKAINSDDGLFFPRINSGCTVETVAKTKGGFRITPRLKRLEIGDDVFKNRDAVQETPAPLTDGSDISRKEIHFPMKKFDIKQKLIKPECVTEFWIMLDEQEKYDYAVKKGFTRFIATKPFEAEYKRDTVVIYDLSDFQQEPDADSATDGSVAVSMNDIGLITVLGKKGMPFCTLNIANSPAAALFPEGFFFSWELSGDEILKNRFRHKGIVYIDGPVRLMTTFHSVDKGIYRDEHHVVHAERKGRFTVINNGDRLLGADHIPRFWGKVGGLCYNGEKDPMREFAKRLDMYRTIIDTLQNGGRIHEIKEALKALAPYTKGLFGEGVV